MTRFLFTFGAIFSVLASAAPAVAQTFPTDDPVIRQMWAEGMWNSQARVLAQTLFDEIGPRLTGSPGKKRGNDWLVDTYAEWGIAAENQEYGTWMRWDRGRTHVDLVEPRVRTLEAALLAWSPGTGGEPLRAEVVTIPDLADETAFEAWLPNVNGKFVAIAFAQPTCRPDADWKRWATEASFTEMREARTAADEAWREKMARIGLEIVGRGSETAIARRMETAGAAGFMARWFSGLPSEFSADVDFGFPGMPGGGGSDYASFVCYGAPSFSLRALNWSYSPYTWHTNRDTFDKVVFADLQHNATLYAMLAYMASEEPGRVPRDRRTQFPENPTTGEAGGWPECQPARRECSERR